MVANGKWMTGIRMNVFVQLQALIGGLATYNLPGITALAKASFNPLSQCLDRSGPFFTPAEHSDRHGDGDRES